MKKQNWKKIQILAIILILASIPLYGQISKSPKTPKTQKTVIIFQETDVFNWSVSNNVRYIDVEIWNDISLQKGFEIVVKYIGQDDFNPNKIIKYYSEISTEMYIIFNVHGARPLGLYFLKLDRWRNSNSIVNAIGNTKTCVVLASCYGELFVKRTFGGLGHNIECVSFSNKTSRSSGFSFANEHSSWFMTVYGLTFVDLLHLYTPYEAFQVMNRNEKFSGTYWSFKTGLIS